MKGKRLLVILLALVLAFTSFTACGLFGKKDKDKDKDKDKNKVQAVELTDKAFYEGTATEDYLHITLTDEEDVAEAVGKLRVIYPNLMKLDYDNTRTRTNRMIDGAEDVQNKSPLELFEELYELQNNQPMSDEQRIFTKELIESIWEGRK